MPRVVTAKVDGLSGANIVVLTTGSKRLTRARRNDMIVMFVNERQIQYESDRDKETTVIIDSSAVTRGTTAIEERQRTGT
jgi:hypothetical protein